MMRRFALLAHAAHGGSLGRQFERALHQLADALLRQRACFFRLFGDRIQVREDVVVDRVEQLHVFDRETGGNDGQSSGKVND